jgi:hypothetical protein
MVQHPHPLPPARLSMQPHETTTTKQQWSNGSSPPPHLKGGVTPDPLDNIINHRKHETIRKQPTQQQTASCQCAMFCLDGRHGQRTSCNETPTKRWLVPAMQYVARLPAQRANHDLPVLL